MIHYIFVILCTLISNAEIETSFQHVKVELKKELKSGVSLYKIPGLNQLAKEIVKINIIILRGDVFVRNIHIEDRKKNHSDNAQKLKEKHILTDEKVSERRAYNLFMGCQKIVLSEQSKCVNYEKYQKQTIKKLYCFCILAKQKKEDFMVLTVPVFVITVGTSGGTIGAILSGPTIPIITVGIGIGFLIKGIKNRKNKSNFGGGGGDNNNNRKNDDDDDEKQRKQKEAERIKVDHPNGEYENNPKHNQNSSGKISKCPKDGQKALDRAIKTKNGRWQVSIEDGKFVIFEEHLPGKWHGYVVENPATMHQDIKNLLFKEGWIQAPNKFKITKRF